MSREELVWHVFPRFESDGSITIGQKRFLELSEQFDARLLFKLLLIDHLFIGDMPAFSFRRRDGSVESYDHLSWEERLEWIVSDVEKVDWMLHIYEKIAAVPQRIEILGLIGFDQLILRAFFQVYRDFMCYEKIELIPEWNTEWLDNPYMWDFVDSSKVIHRLEMKKKCVTFLSNSIFPY